MDVIIGIHKRRRNHPDGQLVHSFCFNRLGFLHLFEDQLGRLTVDAVVSPLDELDPILDADDRVFRVVGKTHPAGGDGIGHQRGQQALAADLLPIQLNPPG